MVLLFVLFFNRRIEKLYFIRDKIIVLSVIIPEGG